MEKRKRNLKAFVLSLGIVAAMALPYTVSAQGVFGDLLDNYYIEMEQDNRGALLRGRSYEDIGINLHNQQFSDDEGGFNLYNQFFEVPLGSGLLILTAAGAGYALKKRKSNNKTVSG